MSVFRIKAKELTKEDFEKYGTVIKRPESDEETIAEDRYTYWPEIGRFKADTKEIMIGITRIFTRPFRTCVMERQFETESLMLALTGDILLIVAESKSMAPDEIVNYHKAEAFIIKQGEGVIFKPGVWYWTPNPIGTDQDVLCCVQKPGDKSRCLKQMFPRGETIEVIMP